jgi:Predicted transcriptional regulators
MKEINIAKALIAKRKEKGITQDELAAYVGVSKASVSKWETGQSYPDITFLPQLATYFNISIDELIGYSPQITKEEIKKRYHKLASKFATRPFDEVMEECRETIKKYYSCFPLLLQMAVLFCNHHMLVPEREQQEEILKEALELCKRIKCESDDILLSKDAVYIEAVCYIMLQQPQMVLELLGNEIRPMSDESALIGRAYQALGNMEKADEIAQIGMFQYLIGLLGSIPACLIQNSDDLEKIEEILKRAFGVAELFHVRKLNPNVMVQICFTAAHVYCIKEKKDKAMEMLQEYADICTSDFFPYTLHGDSFFHRISNWFEEFELGAAAPRSESVIRASMLQAVQDNPIFDLLKEETRYKTIINKLQANMDRI